MKPKAFLSANYCIKLAITKDYGEGEISPHFLCMKKEEFLSSLKRKASGCLEWSGACHKNGYGAVGIKDSPFPRNAKPHRYAYYLYYGVIPKQMVLHKCDNRKCCNPEHLFLGTAHDNTQDMIKKGRHKYTPHRGSSNGMTKLSARDIPRIRKLLKNGETEISIADKFDVTRSAIGAIKHKRTWKHIK